jgi:hypothetical protein
VSTVLGPAFEQGVLVAAGLDGLNVEPGSLRIDELGAENVTVRVTVIGTVPKSVVDGLVLETFGGSPAMEGEPNG